LFTVRPLKVSRSFVDGCSSSAASVSAPSSDPASGGLFASSPSACLRLRDLDGDFDGDREGDRDCDCARDGDRDGDRDAAPPCE
jgi:hypothetical protein